jgi:hypothetical protein
MDAANPARSTTVASRDSSAAMTFSPARLDRRTLGPVYLNLGLPFPCPHSRVLAG